MRRVRGFIFSLSRAKRTVRQAESSSPLMDRVSWNQASARSASQKVANSSAMSRSTSPIRRSMLATYREACRCRSGGITSRFTATPTATSTMRSSTRGCWSPNPLPSTKMAAVAMAMPSSSI